MQPRCFPFISNNTFFCKKKTKPLQGFRGRGAEPHSAKRKNKRMFLVKVLTEGKKKLLLKIFFLRKGFS